MDGKLKSWGREVAGVARDALVAAEERWDDVRYGVKARFGWIGALDVQPYRGFGTERHFAFTGRVTEKKAILPATEQDSTWLNLVHMVRRLESDEIPGARIAVRHAGQALEVRTDSEGYFQVELELPRAVAADGAWHRVEVELLEAVGGKLPDAPTEAEVLVPGQRAEFGVISDIDDTVLHTHVTDLAKMLQVTLLRNAATRLPLEGCAELYRALSCGRSGRPGTNPVFYVSKSPWNMYDLLVDFLERRGLPRGPLLLRELGLHRRVRGAAAIQQSFKLDQIERLFRTYPRLRFVLVGDSGEKDPEIYAEAIRRHPDRVAAVYIREVSVSGRRKPSDGVQELASEVLSFGVDMLLVEHSREIAAHAARRGFMLG